MYDGKISKSQRDLTLNDSKYGFRRMDGISDRFTHKCDFQFVPINASWNARGSEVKLAIGVKS
jgi:hypothetical protein